MTNLKILAVVLGTLGLYTWVANAIPQIESVVPEELSFEGEVTAAQLVAAGEELFIGGGGCTTCHGLVTRAPNLRSDHNGEGTIGQRCDTRVEGMDCKTYLYESLTDPGAFVLEGFDPMVFQARVYSPAQIWAMVAYLQDQGGEVTVTADDVAAAEAEAESTAPAEGAGPTGPIDPEQIMAENLCYNCHKIGDRGLEVGPPLTTVGARLTPEEIRESILDPGATATEGYENLLGSMPPTFGQMLSEAQIEVLVWYLASLQGEDGG